MKKHRIAIVGPCDSVSLIDNIARDYANQIDTIPIVYQDVKEVSEILPARVHEADVWLFSGISPYNYAVATGIKDRPLVYIPHTGSSLYRVLMQITYIERLGIDSISFDTFSIKEIRDTFADISLPLPVIYDNPIKGVVATKDITEYHYNLWKEGKSKVAITCFLATYIELKRLGVPAFRIWPTRDTIRTTIDIAIRTSESVQFKERQIAIQYIAIDDFEQMMQNKFSSYQVKRVDLQLYELLLDYTEAIQGSIVSHGPGLYTIYSTRGSIEDITNNFTVMPLLENIAQKLTIKVSGGIGFGQTAHAADENAQIALGFAHKAGKGKWMVVNDDHMVVGPLSSAAQLRYGISSEDKVCRSLADKLGVSVTTINRLLAVGEKFDGRTLKAEDLALYLSMTSRSARRLLSAMVGSGVAEVVGEEALGKGRPSKLYRVNLQRLVHGM